MLVLAKLSNGTRESSPPSTVMKNTQKKKKKASCIFRRRRVRPRFGLCFVRRNEQPRHTTTNTRLAHLLLVRKAAQDTMTHACDTRIIDPRGCFFAASRARKASGMECARQKSKSQNKWKQMLIYMLMFSSSAFPCGIISVKNSSININSGRKHKGRLVFIFIMQRSLHFRP